MKKKVKLAAYKNPKDYNLFDKLKNIFNIILGLDEDWEKAFFAETCRQAKEIDEGFNARGLSVSGIHNEAINNLTSIRIGQRREEKRRRLIEGLSLLPAWFALLISLISLLVTIIK